ncbi:hypothetical protein [Actinopolyspora mzabensis]|nr:hypothetical protein [Actinopolyspora mzabensis]
MNSAREHAERIGSSDGADVAGALLTEPSVQLAEKTTKELGEG